MATCAVCRRTEPTISSALGVCAACVLADKADARMRAVAAHCRARSRFLLPDAPPRAPQGMLCRCCTRACRIGEGEVGYCGVRSVQEGRLGGGGPDAAAVSWYRDPLPTNCVADWVCPASTAAGYPEFTDTPEAERGYHNLAVFYEACSFDCLFCQNWQFKYHSRRGPRFDAHWLAEAVNDRTRCICFFGGDPSCQPEHALAAAQEAIGRRAGRILRICWETNGSVARRFLKQMLAVSLQSGGCIKFDLKAWDEPLHWALCGASNRATLSNFAFAARWIARRPDPPLLIAATLLVPGYVEADQVGKLARFLAGLDCTIPYALLAFHPTFHMADLPATSRELANECLQAAQDAGLTRVRLGNVHLLR